jgi:hypothetical protein
MAAQSPLSLVTDPAKINPVGASQTDLEEYQKSLDAQIKALEQRYAQPNWFNVAAGFAKPQLGGFLASLGSASQALGETEERRREAELPIAQMRTQLAQSKILTGANKTQADEYEKWRSSGKPMDQATFTRLFSLNPQTPVAEAIKAAYEGQRKDLEFTTSQQRLMMDAIQMKQAKGQALSKPEQDFLANLPGQLSMRQEAQSLLPGGKPTGAEGPAAGGAPSNAPVGMYNLSAPGAVEAVRKGISNIIDPVERARALEALESQINPNRPAPVAKDEKPTVYPPTLTFPNISGLSDQQRESAVAKYNENSKILEGRSEATVNQWRPLAEEPSYSSLDSEYKAAIGLLSTHPDVAKKVFNLLRSDGTVLNQVASAAQAGFGLNFNNMSANLNIPVEAFLRSGLNPEQQLLADRLVRAMLTVGNAKLASQGITPEKGQEAYNRILEGTKASLSQNAPTALHNLNKDYETFKQSKSLYDQMMQEYSTQQANSSTPYTDILKNSPAIKKINETARKEMDRHEQNYSDAIKEMKRRRSASSGG